jgi:hypothetical protein
MPRIEKKDGRYALFVDNAPYLMLSAQAENTSSWPAMLPHVWLAMEFLHVNTVEIPVYWEQFEPRPGRYDYTMIDNLLAEARRHNLRLVLLWFGSYKDGSQHYMPGWMKLDTARYPHAVDKNGQAVDSPAPFATESLEADKSAFAALMRRLKETDSQRTVLMVQVENEAGNWDSVRDYSPAAQKLFDAPVPAEVLKAMRVKSAVPAPNWRQAFGADADEFFNAWSVARYVGQVAAAGKAAYPLPMYANVALRDPFHPGPPGRPGAPDAYESGGPTDNVLDIWKAAAPALDILAPDIYLSDDAAYLKVLELYHRDDNALFVPETGCPGCDRFFFSALGLQAIGFSPFGLDYTRGGEFYRWTLHAEDVKPDEFLAPWAKNYRLVGPMMREVARLNFEGRLQAVAEEQGKTTQTLPFGSWDAIVTYGATRWGDSRARGNAKPIGRVLVAQLKENQFLVAGYDCRVDFRPSGTGQHRPAEVGTQQNPSALIDGKWRRRQFLRVEEGVYTDGKFQLLRVVNGGETDWGLDFFSKEPMVLRVSLATY